jgi:hypothetical protein
VTTFGFNLSGGDLSAVVNYFNAIFSEFVN